MKKAWGLLFIVPLIFLTSCGKNKNVETTTSSTVKEEIKKESVEKKSDIINNMVIGNSKISFNNDEFSKMSEGKFTQNELWGTFEKEGQKGLSIQLDAFDNTQSMYGEISGYELEGINWEDEEAVQYLNVMEEAIQMSDDEKAMMYKARTGDIIFSVALFSENKLTDEDRLTLKALAKGIKIEYADGQVDSN